MCEHNHNPIQSESNRKLSPTFDNDWQKDYKWSHFWAHWCKNVSLFISIYIVFFYNKSCIYSVLHTQLTKPLCMSVDLAVEVIVNSQSTDQWDKFQLNFL